MSDSKAWGAAVVRAWSSRGTAAVLLVVGALVFGPLLETPYLWDDKSLIRDSPGLNAPSNLGHFLGRDFWALSTNPREVGMYRPLVTASYFLDRSVFGVDPRGPHAVNLVLHVLVAGLVALLARRLGAPGPEAALASALFAFHPATVEAVANISSRGDLLATSLGLGALSCLRRSGARWLMAAGLLTALAQLAKESAFVLLPLALMIEWWAAGYRLEGRRWLAVGAALGVASVLSLALHFAVVGKLVPGSAPEGWVPVLSGASTVMRYAGLVVWPSPLVPYQPPTTASVLAAGAVAMGVVGGALVIRRAPLVFVAVAWFAVATAPIAGWLPMEVRFSGLLLYLPLTGLAVLAARELSRVRPLVAWFVAVAEVVMAVAVVPMWTSDEALWRANVEAYPALPAPRVNLANALSAQGAPEAWQEYEAAVALASAAGDRKSLSLAELGLGNLALRSAPSEAEKHFGYAREASGRRMWQAGVNLAVSLALQQRFSEAADVLEAQWSSTPLSSVAERGLLFAQDRQDVEGVARWRTRLSQARAVHE